MSNVTANRVQAQYQSGPPGQGGSPWKKVLLIGGIGCGVLLLVGGLLVGLGVFQIGNWCSGVCAELEAMDELGSEAQMRGHEFALALHHGDYDRAYGMVDESTQQETSLEEFSAEFGEYADYLALSAPFPIHRELDEEVDWDGEMGTTQWRVWTQFSAPQGDERLVLAWTSELERHGDGTVDHSIVDWSLEVEPWAFDDDDYAWAAKNFHRALEREHYREAQDMLSIYSDLDAFNKEGFVSDMEGLVSVLGEAEETRLYGLYPENHVDVMVVRYLLIGDGTRHFLDYHVDRHHEIYDVGDVESAEEVSDEVEAVVDDDTEDVDDEPVDDELEDAPLEEAENEEQAEEEESGGGGPRRPVD